MSETKPPLTKRQQWILGLGGVLSASNEERLDTLELWDVDRGAKFREQERQTLADWWGVTDGVSMHRVLVDLLQSGHRSELAEQVGYPPLAWDIGRYVNVVRWSRAQEYVDEPTAWQLLEAVVGPALWTYSSWGSYVRDYLIGREAWSGSREVRADHAAMYLFMPSMRTKSPLQNLPRPQVKRVIGEPVV